MGFISKNMRDRWDEFDCTPKGNEKQEPPIMQEYWCHGRSCDIYRALRSTTCR